MWVTPETGFNMDKHNFTMAFAIKDEITDVFKYDPSLVEWVVHIIEGDGTKSNVTQEVGVHKCNQSDWDKFFPPSNKSKRTFELYKNKEVMFCMDNVDKKGKMVNKNLFGNSATMANHHLEIVYKPCTPVQIENATEE